MTFGAAMDLWWSGHGRRLRSHTIRRFMEKHLRAELGALPLSSVSERLEALLNAKVGALGPESLNHLRAAVHRVFAFLTRRGAWKGANPAYAVPRFKVPKRLPQYLRPEEVRLMLAALDSRWRGVFATAVYLGLRRGEVIALRKSDVDLHARTLRVGRSHDSDTTKGGHEDLLPIPDELLPWIERALESSPSDVLFPREDGEQHASDVQLQDVLRRALARAGIVNGYTHRCRRKGCGHAERHTYAEPGRCPKCNMRLWPVAEQKPLRFHDLRHSTATLLLKAKVPLATVQKILRHTDPKITSEVYGHLDLEDMREGLNRLHLAPMVTDPDALAAGLLLGPADPKREGPGASRFPEGRQGLQTVGATGFEPATTCTPSGSGGSTQPRVALSGNA
jgi:integrase